HPPLLPRRLRRPAACCYPRANHVASPCCRFRFRRVRTCAAQKTGRPGSGQFPARTGSVLAEEHQAGGAVGETVDVTGQLLARARGGDEDAFAALTWPFRRELQVHCYRILGSAADAEDMLQETMMAAWRGLARFEGRASLRSWLYRIATNKCLNHLRAGR